MRSKTIRVGKVLAMVLVTPLVVLAMLAMGGTDEALSKTACTVAPQPRLQTLWNGTSFTVVYEYDAPTVALVGKDGKPTTSKTFGASSDAHSPAIVATDKGYGLLWYGHYGERTVSFQLLGADLEPVAPPQVLAKGGMPHAPSLAWTGTAFAASWIDDTTLTVRLLYPQGTPKGKPLVVSTTCVNSYAAPPSLVWTGKELAIAWLDFGGDEHAVHFQRISAAGEAVGDPVVVTPSSYHPFLHWDGAHFGIARRSQGTNGKPQVVYSLLDDSGKPLHEEVLWSGAEAPSDTIALAAQPGRTSVVFSTYRHPSVGNDEGSCSVLLVHVGPDGARLDEPKAVHTVDQDIALIPGLAATPDGDTVFWLHHAPTLQSTFVLWK